MANEVSDAWILKNTNVADSIAYFRRKSVTNVFYGANSVILRFWLVNFDH